MKLPTITIPREVFGNYDEAIQSEWLVTNALGGYASSTILGVNTRKYHGLLVASLHPPGDRTVCVAKLDDQIIVGRNSYLLGTNEFHDAIFPRCAVVVRDIASNAGNICSNSSRHVS